MCYSKSKPTCYRLNQFLPNFILTNYNNMFTVIREKFPKCLSKLIFFLHRQVALADVIIINKTDLVNAQELDQIKSSIRYVKREERHHFNWIRNLDVIFS